MDNLDLQRWRHIDAAKALVALADYAKEDRDYAPRLSSKSSRWHVTVSGSAFEIRCTGKILGYEGRARRWWSH